MWNIHAMGLRGARRDLAYYILNTNKSNSDEDDYYMLKEEKAAAFFAPWKYNIERIEKGDVVFLYRSKEGIVAVGVANGIVEKRPYQNDDKHIDEEYCQYLSDFKRIAKPVSAGAIKLVTGIGHNLRSVMSPLEAEAGRKLYAHVIGLAK